MLVKGEICVQIACVCGKWGMHENGINVWEIVRQLQYMHYDEMLMSCIKCLNHNFSINGLYYFKSDVAWKRYSKTCVFNEYGKEIEGLNTTKRFA